MFDIGFREIIVIAIIALLVVGPDKLPGLIKETARWAAKIRRFVIDTKRDIEREINFDDIEKDLSAGMADLENMVEPVPDKAQEPAKDDQPPVDKQTSA